jgi:hypothetical protein
MFVKSTNSILIVMSIVILTLSILLVYKQKKLTDLKNEISNCGSSNIELNDDVSKLKNENKKLVSEIESCVKELKTRNINNTYESYSKRVITEGGVTTTTITYGTKNNCSEDVSGNDKGEIIRKCGQYIIVKTFYGYVVAHSWGNGSQGDEVKGDIWWGIGWEDWLIECKKENVKIETKGDLNKVNEWLQKNC